MMLWRCRRKSKWVGVDLYPIIHVDKMLELSQTYTQVREDETEKKDPTVDSAILMLAYLWRTDELLVPLVMRLKH